MMRTLALALACIFLPGTSLAAGSSTPVIYRAPYLQLATPHSISIVWRTDGPIDPVVRYGRSWQDLDQKIKPRSILVRQGGKRSATEAHTREKALLHSAPAGIYQYEATITGLTPDQKYYYAIYDDKERLVGGDKTYFFRTHPVPGSSKPLRFWVVGDSGTGRSGQIAVQRAMMELTRAEQRPLDFYVHVGDMAYSTGKDVEFQTRVFEMYEPTLRNTVCWPAMGNHEGATSKGAEGIGPYYDAYVLPTKAEAGGVASGTEAFYSFDWGRVHFICLDSHDLDRTPSGAMAQWLKVDLEKTKADWVIAFFHHPPYTKGSHDSDKETQLIEMRTYMVPILESGGVDVVLTGHSHIYERSMLMDGAYSTPTVAEHFIFDDGDGDPQGDGPYRKSAGIHPNEGAVQVVAGHGGASLGRKGTMPVMKRVILEHGSVIIDIAEDTLTGIMLDRNGERRDTFSIVKRGHVTPIRIANPRQLGPWQAPKDTPAKGPGGEPPDDYKVVVPKFAQWSYLTGTHPATNWTEPNFPLAGWRTGMAGFGYGIRNHQTSLAEMQNRHSVVYLRREFRLTKVDRITDIGLMADFTGGFVAYLNGHEVARAGVEKGKGPAATNIKRRDPGQSVYFSFKDYDKRLKEGSNVVSIEAHLPTLDTFSFLIDPWVIVED